MNLGRQLSRRSAINALLHGFAAGAGATASPPANCRIRLALLTRQRAPASPSMPALVKLRRVVMLVLNF